MKQTFTKWLACLALGIGVGSVQAQYPQELPSNHPGDLHIQLVGDAPKTNSGSGEVQVPSTPEKTINAPNTNSTGSTTVADPQIMTTPAFPMTYSEPITAMGGACCPEPAGTGLCAGIGFYYVQPFFSNNPAYQINATRTQTGANTVVTTTTRRTDFDYDYDLAPRIFLGYVSESGLGAKVSWWRFDQSSQTSYVNPQFGTTGNNNTLTSAYGMISSNSSTLPTGASDVLMFDSDVELDVWDFDILQVIETELANVTVGGGIRYLHLSQDYNAYFLQINTTPGLTFTKAERASNVFNVGGPTVFCELSRQLGQSGFSVYGNLRGGILFGTESQTLFYLQNNTMTNQGSLINFNDYGAQRDAVLPFIEGEIGVEWASQGGGVLQPVARCGVVGQNYFNVGSGASNGLGSSTTSSTPGDGNLGFFGLNFLVGANF